MKKPLITSEEKTLVGTVTAVIKIDSNLVARPVSGHPSDAAPETALLPTKRFKPERIDKMNFQVKTEDDVVDERGLVKYESC